MNTQLYLNVTFYESQDKFEETKHIIRNDDKNKKNRKK